MKTRKIIAIFVLILIPCSVFAQFKTQNSAPDIQEQLRSTPTKGEGLVSLIGLDPAKFSMSQSYSLSYFSLGGHGITQGLYLNTMSYRFSDPLQFSVQFGLAHQPFGGMGQNQALLNNSNSAFISAAQLTYRPFKNMLLQLEYNSWPRSRYNYSPASWWMNATED